MGCVAQVVRYAAYHAVFVGVGHAAQTFRGYHRYLTVFIVLIGGCGTGEVRSCYHLVSAVVGIPGRLSAFIGDGCHISFGIIGHGGGQVTRIRQLRQVAVCIVFHEDAVAVRILLTDHIAVAVVGIFRDCAVFVHLLQYSSLTVRHSLLHCTVCIRDGHSQSAVRFLIGQYGNTTHGIGLTHHPVCFIVFVGDKGSLCIGFLHHAVFLVIGIVKALPCRSGQACQTSRSVIRQNRLPAVIIRDGAYQSFTVIV